MFPKFIIAHGYCRVDDPKKTFIDEDIYLKLQSIVDVKHSTYNGVPVLKVHIVENTHVAYFAHVLYAEQIAIVERYIKTAHMDSNQDIITAISDIKEFICHLTTLSDQSPRKKK